MRLITGAVCAVVFSALIPAAPGAQGAPQPKTVACEVSAAAKAAERPSPNDYTAIRRRIEVSPFFRAAVQRAGAATQCKITGDAGSFSVEYRFPKGTVLTSEHMAAIEYARSSLELAGLSEPEAMKLLKAAAFDHFGADPKVQWATDKAEKFGTADTREVVFRGDACNVSARLQYRGAAIVGLAVSSAC